MTNRTTTDRHINPTELTHRCVKPWCVRHDDGDLCWSRTIHIGDAQLELSDGSQTGELALWGLSDLDSDGIDLATARAAVDAITVLLENAAPATARFTWRDLVATNPTLRETCVLEEADRYALPVGTRELRVDCAMEDNTCGGLLTWNRTQDDDGGHLIMFSGQTTDQEQRVIANASWLVSAGAVYPATGPLGWKACFDDLVEVEGDELLVWQLPNNYDMSAVGR